jgi:hypothetical protein
MKMDRAISINVHARKRCTRRSYSIDAKSQPACDLRALCSDGRRAAMHRGKGNRLSPPIWIGAMVKKIIDQRVCPA